MLNGREILIELGEKIAIVDWSHLIEDYLDNINISFDQFKTEMTGGWLFGYIEALQTAGFSPMFFCFSARESYCGIHYHFPTNSEICVLPSPNIYRRMRKKMLNPYADYVEHAVEKLNFVNRPFYSFSLASAEYLSTPLLKLHREFSRQKITKIICQEYESGRFDELVLLAKLTKRTVFATFQGGIRSPNRLKQVIRKFAIKHSDGLICGSKTELLRVKKDYGLGESKAAHIFNPVSFGVSQKIDKVTARKKYGINKNTKVAVWHGRIDLKRKGLDLLVKMWQKLNERSLPFESRLLFFGYGNEAEEFRQLLDSAQIPTIKWFAEFSNDRQQIAEFLSLGDVYVFASRHEGFPVAPIEAMSIGLPLLATDVSGISDILEAGEESGGIVVGWEDVEALTNNLERFFLDDELCLKMGRKAGQRVVEAFSKEQVGLQLKEFLTNNAE